jgi:hypothetical protein
MIFISQGLVLILGFDALTASLGFADSSNFWGLNDSA